MKGVHLHLKSHTKKEKLMCDVMKAHHQPATIGNLHSNKRVLLVKICHRGQIQLSAGALEVSTLKLFVSVSTSAAFTHAQLLRRQGLVMYHFVSVCVYEYCMYASLAEEQCTAPRANWVLPCRDSI